MKKIILLLVVNLFISCSSSDNQVTSNNQSTNSKPTLVKITNHIDNISQNIVFTYNNDFLTKVEDTRNNGDIFKVEFIYVNNKIHQTKNYYNNIFEETNTYTYNGNNITNVVFTEVGSTTNDETKYFYNTNNNLIKEEIYTNNTLDFHIDYEYSTSSNIYKKTHSESPTFFSIYTYDNFVNYKELIYLPEINKINKEGNNNIIQTDVNNDTSTFNEITYNSNNFPIKIIKKKNNILQSTTEITY